MTGRRTRKTKIRAGLKAGEKPGLNRHWRADFLDCLAETSNVSEAARTAGINSGRAYKVRREEPEFARAWLRALWEGYVHLELEVLRRLRGDFQLVKHYGSDGDPQVRRITRPRIETIVASVSGVPVSNWSLEPGGVLGFASAPPQGAEVRAGFLFDVPVRFEEDRIDISGVNFEVGEAPSIPLVEIREAQ